jgi:hypothetical protein
MGYVQFVCMFCFSFCQPLFIASSRLSSRQVTVSGKADRLVAERAQRQRKEAKLAHRRMVYKDSLDQIIEEERMALMKKHASMSSAGTTGTGGTGGPGSALHSRMSQSGTMTPAAIAAMSGANAINSMY